MSAVMPRRCTYRYGGSADLPLGAVDSGGDFGHSARVNRDGRARSAFNPLTIVVPIVLGLGLLVFGFGLGSLCTDIPGNGGLDESPCNRVDLGIKINLGLQALLCVIAVVLGWRWRTTTWISAAIIVLSVAIFVGSFAIARSY